MSKLSLLKDTAEADIIRIRISILQIPEES